MRTLPLRLAVPVLGACSLVLTPAVARVAPTNTIEGIWVIGETPPFPGLRMARIERRGDTLSGTITTDWYGDMPMQNLRMDGAVASFEIDNGNPRLGAKTWTATLSGGTLRIAGDVWHQHVDVAAVPGTEAQARARAFPTYPLPALRALPDNGLARTPPMGWSSWNKFAAEIDDKTVRQIADAMVASGLRDAGYVHINIDDGWQGKRDAQGVLQPNAKFPDMKALADYVHARGMKLGIYSSPGPKTCAGYEGSYGHVEQDARTFAAWGIDYLKYDLCSGEGIYRTPEAVKAAYQQMGAALQASGRPIVYSLCQYGRNDVGAWGRAVGGNLWRTTRDIEDTYESMAKIGFDTNGSPEHVGVGGWNDPDMLEIGNGGMTPDEYRSHMALWAIQAAPLILGHDVRAMDAETRAILTNAAVIAVDQDALGAPGVRIGGEGALSIWRKPLADGSYALAVFNRSAAPLASTLSFAALGLTAPEMVTELWAGRQVAVADGALPLALPPHGTMLFRVR
ncbi:glycoside hydrolase family 27 protein [Sphingomonas flavalba]|uniref:glycoside hydrolase family 27 protein n=1 Tax=Sphingomonas flavalba TaxID=2559804 RepID=UPI0019D2A32F|nr:glycoside hydrolase family 27 protein [Sphingomonas flavalba]